MRHAKSILLACALCFVTAARSDDVKPVDAKQELQAAIDILKTHHMNRAKVDWTKLSTDAFASLGSASKAEEAYPAIRHLITALGVPHTFLRDAQAAKALQTDSDVGQVRAPYWAPPE